MQRAESYAALAPLLSAQLRRGVVTNCFLSTEDYQRELPRGLYYEEREGCLLLLRQRPGHLILNFYLQPGGTFFLPPWPRAARRLAGCSRSAGQTVQEETPAPRQRTRLPPPLPLRLRPRAACAADGGSIRQSRAPAAALPRRTWRPRP